MKLGPSISLGHLKQTLNRAAAELRSTGTIQEPVAKSVGWTRDHLEGLGSRLENYSGSNIDELRTSAQKESKEAKSDAIVSGLGVAGALAATTVALGACSMLALPVVATAAFGIGGLTMSALGVRTLVKAMEAETASRTDAELGTWQNAFQKNFEESAIIA